MCINNLNLSIINFRRGSIRKLQNGGFSTEANKGVVNPAGATISFEGFKLLFV